MSQSIPDIFGIEEQDFVEKNVNNNKPNVNLSNKNIAKLKRIYDIDYKYFGFDKKREPVEQALYAKKQSWLNVGNL